MNVGQNLASGCRARCAAKTLAPSMFTRCEVTQGAGGAGVRGVSVSARVGGYTILGPVARYVIVGRTTSFSGPKIT